MLRQTALRLAAQPLDTLRIYHQMDPTPTRNWRNHYAEKLRPDEEAAKKELHKQREYEEGPDYGKVTEMNFPYPLFWASLLWFPMLVLTCYTDMGCEGGNSPRHVWNPKNADGSTQFPLEPTNPNKVFQFEIRERE